MSVDLGVFHTERPHSDADAAERYMALCAEENRESWLEPSPCVAAFYEELISRFPEQDDATAPWAAWPPDRSSGHVILNLRASEFGKARPVVVALAEKHGLVCFDPQDGRILAAPPGICVAETEPTAEDLAREKTGRGWPWIGLIDSVLKPHGFERRRRIWRRDGGNTVAALELDVDGDVREIWLYLWFKAKGAADISEVGPGRKRHIVEDLRDILPKKIKWALSHVMDPTMYGAGLDPTDPEKRPKWESTLRRLIEEHALVWFDEIEAKPRDYYGWGRFRKWLRSRVGGGTK